MEPHAKHRPRGLGRGRRSYHAPDGDVLRFGPSEFMQQDPVGFYRIVEQYMGPEVASGCHPGQEVMRAHEQAEREEDEAMNPSSSPYWDYFPSNSDPIHLLAKWQRVRIHGLEKKPEHNGKLGWSLQLLSTGRWSVRLLDNRTLLSVRMANLERAHVQVCEPLAFCGSLSHDSLRCVDLCRNLSYKLAILRKSASYVTQMKAAGMTVFSTWVDPTVDDEKLMEAAAEVLMRMVNEEGISSTRQGFLRLAFKLESIDKTAQRIGSNIFGGLRSLKSDGIEKAGFSEVTQQLSSHLQNLKEELCLIGIIYGMLGAEAMSKASPILAENEGQIDDATIDVIQECLHPDPPASIDATDDIIAEVAWASGVEARIRQDAGTGMPVGLARVEEIAAEEVYLLQFSRYPQEFCRALLEGVALRECRSALEDAGHKVVLPSGAKIFVHPIQYKDVAVAIQNEVLRPYHVVVSQSLEHLVQESLQHIPRQLKIKTKGRSLVQVGGRPEFTEKLAPAGVEWDDYLCEELEVKRTFLCVAPTMRNSGSVIQSTTEAHGGVNPRRFVAHM